MLSDIREDKAIEKKESKGRGNQTNRVLIETKEVIMRKCIIKSVVRKNWDREEEKFVSSENT